MRKGPNSSGSQFILITEDFNERTSNVTEKKIVDAVYDIESNIMVVLEKCVPIAIGSSTYAYAMTYDEDLTFAVHVKYFESDLSIYQPEVSQKQAADMMKNFFHSSKVPDMNDWSCKEFIKDKKETVTSDFTVDGDEFRFFDTEDVMAALENIRDGKSKWLHFGYTGKEGGYMEIHRCKDREDFACKVECVKWTKPVATGRHCIISDFESLRGLLLDFLVNQNYPKFSPDWVSFDVEDYFQKLVSKFIENEEM